MAKFIGDLEETCSAILEKSCSAILEKKCSAFFGEKCVGDLEKSFRDFGENGSTITLEIWRNVVGVVMAITYWSLLRSSIELTDREWMLNHNRDKMEISYGDQNFIQHKSGEYLSGAFQG